MSTNIAAFENWGPYLSFGTDASTEIRIAWKSSKYTHQCWVRYGLTPDCPSIKEISGVYPPTCAHVIILKNLQPHTKYYYKISRDPDQIYTFTTGIPPGDRKPFSFNVMGDIHAYPGNLITTGFDVQLLLTATHDFGIALGDSIGDGNDPTHWNAFFAMAADYLKQKPLMNTTGNHDTDNEDKYCRFLNAFPHPYVDPTKGAYYHMEYGNAVFIFIDSSNAGGWEPTPGDDQMEWLEGILAKYARKDQWIFLFFHHQVYSTGDFGCNPLMAEIIRGLTREYHIDAVFYGHDHHYECFWVDRETPWGGTLYFVTGAAGGHHHVDYNIQWDRNGKTKYIWPGRILNVRKDGVPPLYPNISSEARGFRADEVVQKDQLLGVLEPHFMNLTIQGDKAEIKVYGWQRQLFHHLKINRAGAGRHFSDKSEIVIYGQK